MGRRQGLCNVEGRGKGEIRGVDEVEQVQERREIRNMGGVKCVGVGEARGVRKRGD